jgi:hypothetical protein
VLTMLDTITHDAAGRIGMVRTAADCSYAIVTILCSALDLRASASTRILMAQRCLRTSGCHRTAPPAGVVAAARL